MPSAAILNGGRAVRYGGTDKGGLRVGGRTIRDRQLGMLVSVSDDILLVGGAEPPFSGVHDTRARWIPDLHPGQGPLAGLEAAFLAARHEEVIVLACDMPSVTAPFLAWLLTLMSPDDSGVDIVVPQTERGYHPLCAVYRRSTCLPVVTKHLIEGRLAVRDLFPTLRLRTVTATELATAGDPQQLLANVNTPAEHEALATSIAHKAHEL